MFQNLRPEWLVSDKHSSLLGPFLTYEENEVLWIQPLVTYELAQKSIVILLQQAINTGQGQTL